MKQIGFETYHKSGLKIHKKKKHESRSCDKCDEIFDMARDMRIHINTKLLHYHRKLLV